MIERSTHGISSVFVLAGIFLLGVAIGVSFNSYQNNREFQQALSTMIREQNERLDRLLKTQNGMLDLLHKTKTRGESAEESKDKKNYKSSESQREPIPSTDSVSDPRLGPDLIDHDRLRQLVNEESSKTLSAVGEKIDQTAALQKKELDNVRGTLAELKEDIVRLMSNTRNPQAAQAALDLGMKALQSGPTDKALLYLVNAVNHDPKNMTLLKNMADIALMAAKEDLIERAVSVLELATVHVEPENLEELLNIIASLRAIPQKEEELNLSPEQLLITASEIVNDYKPERVWRNAEMVAAAIEQAATCERNLKILYGHGQDQSISRARGELLSLMEQLKLVQEIMPVYDRLDACVREMKGIVDNRSLDEPLFMTLANSATVDLSGIAGVLDRLPQTMRNELAAVPGKLKELEDVFLERLSEASYSRSVEGIRRSMGEAGGSYTQRIKRIADTIGEAQAQLLSLRSERLSRQLAEEIQKAREELRRLEVDREAKYQEWAVTNAHGFLAEWNKRTITTDNFAKELFAKYEISKIDERLLIPEASRLVQHVVGLVTAELNAVDGAEIEYKMATDKKKRLEDF
jgi:hypothetical protein